MDQKVINYCKALVKKGIINRSQRAWPSHDISNFGAIYSLVKRGIRDKLVSAENTGVCHGKLQNHPSRIGSEALVTLVLPFSAKGYPKTAWKKEENLLYWYNWIANESSVADVFITKDAKEMIEEGCILDTTKPTPRFIQACILTRIPSELHARRCSVNLFEACLESGVYPPLACIVAHSVQNQTVCKTSWIQGFNLISASHPHSPYYLGAASVDKWRLFMAGEMCTEGATVAFNSDKGWGGVFKLSHLSYEKDKYSANNLCNILQEKLSSVIKPFIGEYTSKSDKGSWSLEFFLTKEADTQAAEKAVIDVLLAFQEQIQLPEDEWEWNV